MEQVLSYRGVRYVIFPQSGESRLWVIYPEGGPEDGAADGFARIEGPRGSFKSAVMAARQAIDAWIADHGATQHDQQPAVLEAPSP